jgi:2-hydroxy-3-oxopropionate reductase
MEIGFIGFGTMGQAMAGHLLDAGHSLHVWSRRPASADFAVARGARRHASVRGIAEAAEIVCTNVTGSDDVAGLARDLLPGFRAGSIHIDFSTISPAVARQIGAAYEACGVAFVDAPVSGGGVGARNATLAIMWGGKAILAARLAPVFSRLGKVVVHVGDVGAGQVAKACNQMVMVAAIAASAEAARFAAAAGIDFALVREAMLGGSAGSRVLDVFGGRMARREFEAGVEARLHHKDYALLMDEASRIGVPLPVSAAVSQQLNALMAQGMGGNDTAVILRTLELTQGE